MTRAAWRTPAGHVLAVAAALLIAASAFLYRFNALGGAFGGFDNDEFFVLTRVDMILHGEQPLRDFAEAELRGAWPSLTYQLPAWAQQAWGHNLLVHAWLSAGILAACAGGVFLLARTLAGQWIVGLLAAAAVVASTPKLYNYPKVLVLVGAVAALRWALWRPTPLRLAVLAAWTVVAALFRHDYGVYLGFAAVAGIVVCEPRPWRLPVRRVAAYVAAGLVFSLPSIVWVSLHRGVGHYIADSLASTRAEGRRLVAWPAVLPASPFAPESLAAAAYYAFWALPLAALVMLAVRRWRTGAVHQPERGLGVALVIITLVVNYFFLRSNLPARFGDGIAATVLAGAWAAGAASGLASPAGRAIFRYGPAALMAVLVGVFVQINAVSQELGTGGVTRSPRLAVLRFQEVSAALRALPPERWAETEGPLRFARYLAECTAPDDRVLVGMYADVIPYYARRRFAAGQGVFAHALYTSDEDQQLALQRLGRQSVPVAITSAVDYEGGFASDYPLVARYIAQRYREAGIVTSYGQPYLRVFVDASREPRGLDAALGLPCFR